MEEAYYHTIGQAIPNSVSSKLFGKLCYKINGKPFVSFFNQCMVFKLQGTVHQEALSLEGAMLFDPSGKGRAMKEWVQVPYQYKEYWGKFANEAMQYVLSLQK